MNAVVISLDVELGWGFHDLTPLPAERLRTARRNWDRLRRLFDEYRIPATWAIVGHLLAEDCDAVHENHPAGERCCTHAPDGLAVDDVWFGEDLVPALRDAAVDHELASHGFTHVHFAHERMSHEFATRELRSAIDASRNRAFSPDSFVFPVNEVGYRDLLADEGFTCYRGRRPDQPGKPRKLAEAVLDRGAPPLVTPTVDEYGLVNVPASLNLFAFEGWARSLVEPFHGDPVTGRVRRGIDRLRDEDGVFHLWFHPHDLTRERKFDRLRAVLGAVAAARDRGDIAVETMGTVAARVAAENGTVDDRAPPATTDD